MGSGHLFFSACRRKNIWSPNISSRWIMQLSKMENRTSWISASHPVPILNSIHHFKQLTIFPVSESISYQERGKGWNIQTAGPWPSLSERKNPALVCVQTDPSCSVQYTKPARPMQTGGRKRSVDLMYARTYTWSVCLEGLVIHRAIYTQRGESVRRRPAGRATVPASTI